MQASCPVVTHAFNRCKSAIENILFSSVVSHFCCNFITICSHKTQIALWARLYTFFSSAGVFSQQAGSLVYFLNNLQDFNSTIGSRSSSSASRALLLPDHQNDIKLLKIFPNHLRASKITSSVHKLIHSYVNYKHLTDLHNF